MGLPEPSPASQSSSAAGWGLIAGNGRFPFLVLEGARSQGIEMAVIALKEEASPELSAPQNEFIGWDWENWERRLICCIRKT